MKSAAELAQEYLDAAPAHAQSADDYEWEYRSFGMGEMLAAHLGDPGDGIDPCLSSKDPVVVSLGDGELTPIYVWDGVHRILSSIKSGQSQRMAAVGIKKHGEIHVDDLPEDMQVLLMDYFDMDEKELPKTVPVRAIRVKDFPEVGVIVGKNDDRGEPHAAAMVGQHVPPVVVIGDCWMDGRHRVHAARAAGHTWLLGIDLDGLIAESALNGNYIAKIASSGESPKKRTALRP